MQRERAGLSDSAVEMSHQTGVWKTVRRKEGIQKKGFGKEGGRNEERIGKKGRRKEFESKEEREREREMERERERRGRGML